MDINVFTVAMRTEFERGFQAVADPAPIDDAILTVPSTAREENYAWLSPVPGIARYEGYRRFGKISEIAYRLINNEYDAGFEVLTRDVEDDQTGGYTNKAKDLSLKAKLFPGRSCLDALAAGQAATCFDGSNFFGATHIIGTGANEFAGVNASTDSVTHAMVGLVTAYPVKPLIWQNRKGPAFMTDAGTPHSSQSKTAKYWIDLEGASGYGYWWDAILCTFDNTPTVPEVQTAFGEMEGRFRQFQLPTNLATDTAEHIHEQITFSDKTFMVVTSSLLGHLARQALSLSLIGSTENIYKGYAKHVTSAKLDAMVA